ncbi:MAG: hypothetical protein QMC41_06365 [Halioglobus sp.]|mgnify:FL=1|jgi:hypothetical protein|uniref:hypothetical protein n=1 Tax=Halioglobus sp. Uisw_031 TaxID=3230977 RepID=UPI0035914F70|tara:strand:- start:1006 stop:1383 length:378 start_codon:yes stop_codon:yes gene_type:complete
MNSLLRALVALPAIGFLVIGLRWAIDPSSAASDLGMTLLSGVGRSSQIGDVGALFLSMGSMILIALTTGQRSWFYAPALMLSLIAVLRILAWLLHGAALTLDMIILEVIVASLLLLASSRLSRET